MIHPRQFVCGLLYAWPVTALEWYLLTTDGPWWLPHPAGEPAPAAWLVVLGVCSLLTLVVAHATAMILPGEESWEDFWKLYLGMMQGFVFAGYLVALVAVNWYFCRQVLTYVVPVSALAFHGAIMVRARR